jgi:hypothetical protein
MLLHRVLEGNRARPARRHYPPVHLPARRERSMTTELDITAIHAPGTDLARYAPQPPEEYRARFVMSADQAKENDRQLRDMMRAVLTEGTDYGTIPGMGDKPSLFKPGAEKLNQWFGFGFSNDRGETDRNPDGTRLGVTYRCTITKDLADGHTFRVATCEGYAGYDEERFYISAEAAERKERANAVRYRRNPNPSKFTEYRAPWNTILKMAQKRAFVGAVLDATAAGGLFTQDLEDMQPPSDASPAETAHPAQPAAPPPPKKGQRPGQRSAGEAHTAPAARDTATPPAAGAAPDTTDYDTPGTAPPDITRAIWSILRSTYHFSTSERDQARAVTAHIARTPDLASSADLSRNQAALVLDTLRAWEANALEAGEEPRAHLIAVMAAEEEARHAG